MIERKTEPNQSALAIQANDGIEYGLTKREYFAAIAMQGLLAADLDWSVSVSGVLDSVAETAVAQADALMAALNEGKKPGQELRP